MTVCTHDRKQILGSYDGNAINITRIGSIVNECVNQIPQHYCFSRVLAHSIQCDHFHLLIELNVAYRNALIDLEGFQHPVTGSIATIVRSLKAAVTRAVRIQFANPDLVVWQRGYDLRPIKTSRALSAVRYYVKNNTSIHIGRLRRRNGRGVSPVDTGAGYNRWFGRKGFHR